MTCLPSPPVVLPEQPSFTIKEAMFYLGVSRMTIYRMIHRGELVVSGPRFFQKISADSLRKKVSHLSHL